MPSRLKKTASKQRNLYRLVVVGAFVVSSAGVVWAARYPDTSNGGRGGAIAVIVAFAVLFLRRDYGKKSYDTILEDVPEQVDGLDYEKAIQALHERVLAVDRRVALDADGQRLQNKALTWASVIGTIFWGFGDLFAAWLRKLLCYLALV